MLNKAINRPVIGKKRLRIDCSPFRIAFNRDIHYHDAYPKSIYLNLESGQILVLYDQDSCAELEGSSSERNKLIRNDLISSPSGYLIIPGRTHGDHHDILKEFLESEWTENEQQRSLAKRAYWRSIGDWLSHVNNSRAVQAYHQYKNRKLEEVAERYLFDHGIEPEWY